MSYKRQKFTDPSDFLSGEGKRHVIDFYHIPTGKSVEFKAWVTEFSDKFDSEWGSEEAYGRMDPIQTFKKTTRTISLGWQVVATSESEAIQNMAKCQILFKMLYPVFGGDKGKSLQAPPLIKLKFVNFIQDAEMVAGPDPSTAEEAGLTGTVAGFTYAPDFDAGFFDSAAGTLYPKVVTLECTFTALHTHELGYGTDGKWLSTATGFPYTDHMAESEADELFAEAMEDLDVEESVESEPAGPQTETLPQSNQVRGRQAGAHANRLGKRGTWE